MAGGELEPAFHHALVFIHVVRLGARHGAGCNPHGCRLPGRQPTADRRIRRGRAGGEIVLEIACHFHPLRRRAQRQKALAHFRALRLDPVHRRPEGGEPPRPAAIAGEGAVRNAAVENRQAGAGPLGLAEQVGPDLGLHHQHHRGPQAAQHPAHGENVIHGRKEDPVHHPVQFGLRRGVARQRAGGDEKPGTGKCGAKPAHQLQRAQHFPHRNRVQPDGALAGLSK